MENVSDKSIRIHGILSDLIAISEMTEAVFAKALNMSLDVWFDKDEDLDICVVETSDEVLHLWPAPNTQDDIEDICIKFAFVFKNVNKIHLLPLNYARYNEGPKERITV